MRKIFFVFAVAAILCCQNTQASDLQKVVKFELLHSENPALNEIPVTDEAIPGEEHSQPEAPEAETTPSQPPTSGDSTDAQPLPPADSGAAPEEPNATPSMIGNLVESVYDLESPQKLEQASAFVINHKIALDDFTNLVKALKLAGLEDIHADSLVGLYGTKRVKTMQFDSFQSLIHLFSAQVYTNKKSENWPFLLSAEFIENRPFTFDNFRSICKQFYKSQMAAELIQDHLMVSYVQTNGKKLPPSELNSLLRLMNEDPERVQPSALMVESWIRHHATELTKPEFREEVEDLLQRVPSGENLNRISNMSKDAKENLLYSEYHYFQPLLVKDLLFTIHKIIKLWKANVAEKDWERLAKTFILRNEHRLDKGKIEKIKAAFSIE